MNTFRKFINEMKDVSQFNTRKIDIEFGIEMHTGKTKEGKDFYLLKKDGSYVGKTPQRGGYPGSKAARNARVKMYADSVNKKSKE